LARRNATKIIRAQIENETIERYCPNDENRHIGSFDFLPILKTFAILTDDYSLNCSLGHHHTGSYLPLDMSYRTDGAVVVKSSCI
jgi:hypothetical protein